MSRRGRMCRRYEMTGGVIWHSVVSEVWSHLHTALSDAARHRRDQQTYCNSTSRKHRHGNSITFYRATLCQEKVFAMSLAIQIRKVLQYVATLLPKFPECALRSANVTPKSVGPSHHCVNVQCIPATIKSYSFSQWMSMNAFTVLTLLVGCQEEHPACKIEWWGVGARSTDCLHMVQLRPLHPKTPSPLASFKSRLVYLSDTGLPRLSWKRGRYTDVVVIVVVMSTCQNSITT